MIRILPGALVAAGYLAFTGWISHAVLIPPEVAEYQPGWVVPALLAAHVVAGAGLGRWAFVLPPAWVLVSVPAGRMYMPDIDPPIWVWVLVLAVVWLPAVAAGTGVRRLARSFAGRRLLVWTGLALLLPFHHAAVLVVRVAQRVRQSEMVR